MLSVEHKRTLARAIRSFLRSAQKHEYFNANVVKCFKEWATNLETDCANENELQACRWIAYLPYTQPPIEDEPCAFALFCAAIVAANGGCFDFPCYKEITQSSGREAQVRILKCFDFQL